MTLTERERFLRHMHFQPVDRIPCRMLHPAMEMGFWTETFERWYHEGLPRWVTFLDHFVPPDVPYDTYRYYVDRRCELVHNPQVKL